jgi:CRISPR system Cascade subunit CasB
MDKPHDEMALYRAWGELDSGASAQLRRVTEPEELLDVPAFYRLAQPHGWLETGNRNALLRQVFCLSAGKDTIKHTDKKVSLGEALARVNRINERRIYQLLRAEQPNDMVQLRRLLVHAEPTLNWPLLAKQLRFWNKSSRRQLLEDFVLVTSQNKTA